VTVFVPALVAVAVKVCVSAETPTIHSMLAGENVTPSAWGVRRRCAMGVSLSVTASGADVWPRASVG
jgi:hypothetical protein